MSKHGALVVFGSGPGVGQAVASHFASQGFGYLILVSRNESRLAQDAAAVQSAAKGTVVDSITADVSDAESLKRTLQKIDRKLAAKDIPLEVVLYNAARVGESKLLEFPVEGEQSIINDLKITVSGFYSVSQWAAPKLTTLAKNANKSYKPSFLVTGGMLHKIPIPGVFSLSLAKAAQYNLFQSLYKVHEPLSVHYAMICIGGVVGQDTRPEDVSDKFWELYQEEAGKFRPEIELIAPGYWEFVERGGK